MQGQKQVYEILETLKIQFQYFEHPPVSTIEIAEIYWKNIEAIHCKNIFLRNHKGNKHYLMIIECHKQIDIHLLEKKLNQGKLSFASNQRLTSYLGLASGAVSPFGLINNTNHDVDIFIDDSLFNYSNISFHPNVNTASIVIAVSDFLKYIKYIGNQYFIIPL
jgi:Ala-tRNA(Pro) deacylase